MRRVLVHGFTQTAASWRGVLDGEALEVVPGADLWATAAALAEAAGPGAADWVGYSMGGRLALHVALARPEQVRRLVLLGAHPGIDDDGGRAARRAADERLAHDIERNGVNAFLERWLAQPLFAGLRGRGPGPRQQDAAVVAACLRRLGTGTQEPLWHRLGELRMPVLALAGEHDETYAAVGRRVAAAVPDGRFAAVPGAGHAAHLEQPAAFRALVEAFLGEP